MAAGEEGSLEFLLNKATNPVLREEDWEAINAFCDQVNNELEGPQIAVRLLAHKIQSPQEREALYALTTTESCVKNCGQRFHQEVGKFRFLNEIIKVISPKYLGSMTTDKVKRRCIELMYSWTVGLKHETKIGEAYQMLKSQGIVKEDPCYEPEVFQPPPEPRRAVFEDDEKSKLLSKLLKSTHPEDLQAANRLIKNMVKQDEQRMEKVTRRINELEAVNNNVKLLSEMLEHYRSNSATEADRDLMKDLFETLNKKRPTMFRLASDTDEEDGKGIVEILKANDEVTRVMGQYRRIVEGISDDGDGTAALGQDAGTSLLDLNTPSPAKGDSLLENELAALGLTEAIPSGVTVGNSLQQSPQDGNMLNQLLGNTGTTFPMASAAPTTFGFTMPALQPSSFPVQPPSQQNSASPSQPLVPLATHTAAKDILDTPNAEPAIGSQPSAFDSFDSLGKTLIEQGLPAEKKLFADKTKPKVSMNQMVQQSAQGPAPGATLMQQPAVQPMKLALPAATRTTATTPHSLTASPHSATVLPMTDLFVPLDSIKSSTQQPITVYDKNGIRLIIHFALNIPRDDVRVMVISVMSTNTSPVKSFMFQAAVPKVMKVKLQPPSATDLPAFNPVVPPSAITQVMLLANPQREPVRLKFKISYSQDNKTINDVGEVGSFPAVYEEVTS